MFHYFVRNSCNYSVWYSMQAILSNVNSTVRAPHVLYIMEEVTELITVSSTGFIIAVIIIETVMEQKKKNGPANFCWFRVMCLVPFKCFNEPSRLHCTVSSRSSSFKQRQSLHNKLVLKHLGIFKTGSLQQDAGYQDAFVVSNYNLFMFYSLNCYWDEDVSGACWFSALQPRSDVCMLF